MESAPDEVLSALRRFLDDFDQPELIRFMVDFNWSMRPRNLEPKDLPCLRHLRDAARLANGKASDLLHVLENKANALRWDQTYTAEDFGKEFLANYGWVELFGIRGHFVNERMAGGFLVLGPNVHYPDHYHMAEELYIPLTSGTLWRMGNAEFATRGAGAVIHHRSAVTHAMKTRGEPLVAFYLWRGGPLAERSTID